MRVIKQLLTPKLADIPMPTFIENYLTHHAGRAGQVRDNSVGRDETVTGHGPV